MSEDIFPVAFVEFPTQKELEHMNVPQDHLLSVQVITVPPLGYIVSHNARGVNDSRDPLAIISNDYRPNLDLFANNVYRLLCRMKKTPPKKPDVSMGRTHFYLSEPPSPAYVAKTLPMYNEILGQTIPFHCYFSNAPQGYQKAWSLPEGKTGLIIKPRSESERTHFFTKMSNTISIP